MEIEYAVGGLSIKSSKDRFAVFRGSEELDSFNNYEDAAVLLSDLHLSKKASDDDKIGTKVFCPAMFGNGNAVVVVAKVEDGYIVQPVGSTDRMTIAEEHLSDIPELFSEDK